VIFGTAMMSKNSDFHYLHSLSRRRRLHLLLLLIIRHRISLLALLMRFRDCFFSFFNSGLWIFGKQAGRESSSSSN